jgi:hypothetical protein
MEATTVRKNRNNYKMYILLLVVAVIFIGFQSFITMSTNDVEKQQYRVVKTEEEFEIRFYPPAILATVRSSARSYREISSSGFRRIAGYIFGNNESSTKIAMTSPVHMDDQNSSMSFVMPSKYSMSELPKPNDPSLELHESPAQYVAALTFSGYASDEKIKNYSEQLKAALDQKGIKTVGHFSYLGYNPPYQVVGRKNEIIVAVEWKE